MIIMCVRKSDIISLAAIVVVFSVVVMFTQSRARAHSMRPYLAQLN